MPVAVSGQCVDRVWRARDDVLYRKLVDGGLVYDSVSTRIHHLNDSAAFVWEACQGGSQIRDIVTRMCGHYESEAAGMEQDVTSILKEFDRVNLLEPVGE